MFIECPPGETLEMTFVSPVFFLIHHPPEAPRPVNEVHHSERKARERSAELRAAGTAYTLARGRSSSPASRETLEEYTPA